MLMRLSYANCGYIVNNTSDIIDVVEFEEEDDNKGSDKHAV